MFAYLIILFSIATLVHGRVVLRQTCDDANITVAAASIVFDGRVNANATKTDFDSSTGPYGPDFVKGQTDITFQELVAFPNVEPSILDAKVGAKAVEVQINDKSIFAPGGNNAQTAVRRTELIPNGGGNTTTGIKTLHVSLRASTEHPLNISHEYSLVFLERADFSANLFMLRTGTLLGSNGSTKNDLVLQGNTATGTKTLFTVPFTQDVWTNLALRLDFTANTIQIFTSSANMPLVQATEPLENDLSGNGAFHFGVNKNPTDPGADILRSGFQESGILEGVVYGGILVEDTANATVTLS